MGRMQGVRMGLSLVLGARLLSFGPQKLSASSWTMGPRWMTLVDRGVRASPHCMMLSPVVTLKWLSCSLSEGRLSPSKQRR